MLLRFCYPGVLEQLVVLSFVSVQPLQSLLVLTMRSILQRESLRSTRIRSSKSLLIHLPAVGREALSVSLWRLFCWLFRWRSLDEKFIRTK